MKKTFLAIFIAFSGLLLILPSCEKEETALLSDYIKGPWSSQEIIMDDVAQIFFINIKESTYTLRMFEANNTQNLVDFDEEVYTVINNENKVTMAKPDFPGEEPSNTTDTYSVSWDKDSDTMTWVPLNSGPPTFIWTRSTKDKK